MKLCIQILVLLTILSIQNVFAADKPNVVIMMVDNLGWGELGTYGGGELRGAPTPNLDALAAEGIKMQNFNVEPQCTPSRSAFMTGRHPIRSGTTKVVWGVLYGMTQWEKTFPELMSEQGYSTGMFGKWHLGDVQGRFPTDQGFDEWYGIANTTDEAMYSSNFDYDQEVSSTPYIVESTRNKKPFLAFVPFTHAHIPTTSHPDFEGKTGNGPYADVLAEIDHRSGQILQTIDELGIKDNTIVLWLSDNGPEEIEGFQGTAGYWRGHYFTALEGSLRVPAIMRWPGKIPANSVSNEIMHIVDVLPTLAKVAGYKVPNDRKIDGVNQLDWLMGKQEKSNREGFPIYNGDTLFAYKWRNWKMHLVQLDSMLAAPKRLNMPHLFNLIQDPKEKYPATKVDVSGSWVFPVMFKNIVAFQKTLQKEPVIPLGTPDPYLPKK